MTYFFPAAGKLLMPGDLLFQTEGNSEFSEAISSATASSDSVRFVHVAMVCEVTDSCTYILEADPQEGVRKTTLDEFTAHSPEYNGKPGVVIMRLEEDFQIGETLRRAESFIGQPYDWWYLPDNGKIYCSELIYESYITNEGNRIFEAAPMNFRAPDGSMPEFWIKLYDELGVAVPEGLPGTNPNDLSKHPHLRIIESPF